MKKVLFILILMNISLVACAQQQKDIPVLIKTSIDSQLPRLEIETSCVDDTTRVLVSVFVKFDKKFSKSVQLTTPKEIYVLGFAYIDKKDIHKTDEKYVFEKFDYSDFLYTESEFMLQTASFPPTPELVKDGCIREACNTQFKIWLKEQPYSEMYDIDEFFGCNGLAFSFPVYLIPYHF